MKIVEIKGLIDDVGSGIRIEDLEYIRRLVVCL